MFSNTPLIPSPHENTAHTEGQADPSLLSLGQQSPRRFTLHQIGESESIRTQREKKQSLLEKTEEEERVTVKQMVRQIQGLMIKTKRD